MDLPRVYQLLLIVAAPFVGSFLGVVIHRLPAGLPIVWGRSVCRRKATLTLRKARLLEQMELELEELETRATEDELAAEMAAARTTMVQAFTRRRPARKPFLAHLPRERVVIPAPTSCGCCGSDNLAKLGEDVTETLEVIPRKVIQTVREKFTCRACEKITQAPAPPELVEGPCRGAWLGRAEPARHDPIREVRPASAAEQTERALCAGGTQNRESCI